MSEDRYHSNHKRRKGERAQEAELAPPKARLRWLRGSPQKAREVIDLIRGKDVNEAISILRVCKRKAAVTTLKCLKSAMANAHETKKLKVEHLFVESCYVEEGPRFKRIMPRARGRADRLYKRMHHTVIVLGEKR